MKRKRYQGRQFNSKGKEGTKVKCPRCKYSFKTKQKVTKQRPLICCSKCKRWVKPIK